MLGIRFQVGKPAAGSEANSIRSQAPIRERNFNLLISPRCYA